MSQKLKKVIEIGSGDGHNLLFLASRFKELEFIGTEKFHQHLYILPRRQAKKFEIANVNFMVGDLADPQTYKSHFGSESAVFSVHALEEMPRIYKTVLNSTTPPKGLFSFSHLNSIAKGSGSFQEVNNLLFN